MAPLRSTPGSPGPATQITETDGPTTLDIAAIADGEGMKRSGTDVIGFTIAGGSTVTEDTLATILALGSPVAGDIGIPTDSPYELLRGNSGWRYKYNGYWVVPPITGDWTSTNLQGSSTRTSAGGVEVLTLDNAANWHIQGAWHTASHGTTYTVGMWHEILNGAGAGNEGLVFGFMESATSKVTYFRFESDSASLNVVRAVDLDTGAASKPYDEALAYWQGPVHFVRITWAANVVSFDVGASPVGPWHTVHSEAEDAYFTTAPNRVFWGATNRTVGDIDGKLFTLFHFAAV